MTASDNRPPILFLDDGWPEARDYDDNYLPLGAPQAGHWLRDLLTRITPRRRRGSSPRPGGSHPTLGHGATTPLATPA